MQNHLFQLLALVAMETPKSLAAEDIRDAKVNVLKCVAPPSLADAVMGQYTASGDQKGYKDDPAVPQNSTTPTFAAIVFGIQNQRWENVPFILKCGKGNGSLSTCTAKGVDKIESQRSMNKRQRFEFS